MRGHILGVVYAPLAGLAISAALAAGPAAAQTAQVGQTTQPGGPAVQASPVPGGADESGSVNGPIMKRSNLLGDIGGPLAVGQRAARVEHQAAHHD